MSEPRSNTIRNVAIVGPTGAGKTSLGEALLYTARAIPAIGSVLGGNTVSDFEPEETHHKFSISSSVLNFTWKDTIFNLVDTPGSLSFLGEAKTALRGVDGVLIVLSASTGVRTELEKVWADITDLRLPCLLFINDLDKEHTDFRRALDDCQKALEFSGLPLVLPVGQGPELSGVVDVLANALIRSSADNPKVEQGEVPGELSGALGEARKALAEAAAETEDQLLEKYLGEGDLSAEEISRGLQAGTGSKAIVPVLGGSAIRNIGPSSLLDAMAALLPSAAAAASFRPLEGTHPQSGEAVTRQPTETDPFSAFVLKTIIDPFVGHLNYVRVLSGTLPADSGFFNATRQSKEKGGHLFIILGKKYTQVPSASAGDIVAIGKLKETHTGDTLCDERQPILYPRLEVVKPVLSFAIEPKSKADIEKVSLGFHKLVEEDPSLEFVRNVETKEMILSGTGQQHVDVTFEKLRRKYGAEVNVHTPKVPYKETIRKTAQAQGRHKKQTGGHGQFGDCWLQLDPLPRGKGFQFVNKIVGGAIPRQFIPAVEKGVHEALHEGSLAGCPVVDLQVTVYDGSYHTVDSSEMAFKIAASMGFKKAMESAQPVLLEPIMTVEVATPDDCVGAVIGDLNSKRGRVLGITTKGNTQVMKALVPLSEMLKYAPSLNSLTGGRGTYSMEFSSYEEVPRDIAPKLIEEQKAAKHAVAS